MFYSAKYERRAIGNKFQQYSFNLQSYPWHFETL